MITPPSTQILTRHNLQIDLPVLIQRRLIPGFQMTQQQLDRKARMLMGILVEGEIHRILLQHGFGDAVQLMGDKGAHAQPLVLLQDIPHFGIARADARKVGD